MVDRQDPLSNALRLLFQGELDWYRELVDRLSEAFSDLPQPVDSSWLTSVGYSLGDPLEVSFVTRPQFVGDTLQTVRQRVATIERDFDLTVELSGLTKADLVFLEPTRITLLSGYSPFEDPSDFSPTSHAELDARSLELASRLVRLIKRNPTLITRAKRYVNRRLDEEGGGARTDLAEWKQILDGFSQRRLDQILVDPGERATRLRQSAPFFPVLTEDEKEELRAGEHP